MGYCIEPDQVRVDFFKQNGKWYTTESIKFLHYHGDIYDCFKESLRIHFKGEDRLKGMWAVCLHPYHEHSHPIAILI